MGQKLHKHLGEVIMQVLGDLENPLGQIAAYTLTKIEPSQLEEAWAEIYRRFGIPFISAGAEIDLIVVKPPAPPSHAPILCKGERS